MFSLISKSKLIVSIVQKKKYICTIKLNVMKNIKFKPTMLLLQLQ
jgi:hypothetical protein